MAKPPALGFETLKGNLSVPGSCAIFTAGNSIKDTGSDETIQLAGLELMYRY